MTFSLSLFSIILCCWYGKFLCESKAISIAYTDDNDTLRLNLTALRRVLYRPGIQNKKLMVVSIVGEMRTGKSFISGFNIRYLHNRKVKRGSWMGDGQTKSNGFAWGPGTKINTTGIDMWDELFVIKDACGEEVVIVLLDTQGLFDTQSSMANTVRMNAINILGSSLLITNFQKQITERDLQNWELSAEFAKLASSLDEDVFEPPKLLVLVQNWQNSHEYAFGLDGGKSYIDHVLGRCERRAELNAVRQNIATSFESVDCFLMPFPGEKVMNPSFRGTNNEVKEIYLQYVKKYVEHIFDTKNLAIKQLQKKSMTPKLYYDFLVAVDKTMSSDKIPKTLMTLGENFARNVYFGTYQVCLKNFEQNMTDHADRQGIIGKNELEKLYDFEKEYGLQCYKSSKKIGSPELRKELKKKLREDMSAQFQIIEKLMDAKRKEHVIQIMWKLYDDFVKKIDEITNDNPTNFRSLQKAHLEFRDLAAETFHNKSLNCQHYAMEYGQKFLKMIDGYYLSVPDIMQEKQKAQTKCWLGITVYGFEFCMYSVLVEAVLPVASIMLLYNWCKRVYQWYNRKKVQPKKK